MDNLNSFVFMETLYSHEYFMREALKLAQRAFEEDEVPVGAVVVSDNRIIGKGYNQTELLKDATAHAEMLAITSAFQYLGSKYLKDCTLYVTLEPCAMCAGALSWAQVGQVIYGASDLKRGFTAFSEKILHPKTKLEGGVLAEDCRLLIQSFFQAKR